MPITEGMLDQLLNKYEQPEDLLGVQGILQQFLKALVERALEAGMTNHIGYKKHESVGDHKCRCFPLDQVERSKQLQKNPH